MPTSKPANIFLYGKGVFSTIAFYDLEPFLWDKHWSRLTGNAAKLGIDVSAHNERSVRNAVSEAIEKHKTTSGRVRITFFDESTSTLWGGNEEKRTGLSIIAGDARKVPEKLRLTISPHRVNTTSPLAGVKSCNYLEPLMACREAASNGFDEAVRLNERGEVSSACMANVFWLKDGRLFTPSLKTGCLAGTTREHVLEKLECEEVEDGIEAVKNADEIFLTSAGIGVVRAAAFDGRSLRKQHHEILELVPSPT